MATAATFPANMKALVVPPQVLCRAADQVGSPLLVDERVAVVSVHDVYGSIDEAILVPVRAAARLPLRATEVTELGPAATS